jgi:hypothetical protein
LEFRRRLSFIQEDDSVKFAPRGGPPAIFSQRAEEAAGGPLGEVVPFRLVAEIIEFCLEDTLQPHKPK